MFSVDTKGGNRPIRLALKDVHLHNESSYGKSFMLAYAFGDKLVIQDNWGTNDVNGGKIEERE
jgi:hypothetical protein